MTKMHFEEAARTVRSRMGGSPLKDRILVARSFADLFARYNPRFNRAQFFAACHITQECVDRDGIAQEGAAS